MPKRINNIFKEAVTFSKLLEAHNKTKKGKRYKKQVIEFEMNLESNIIQMGKELLNGAYTFSDYFEFTIYEPKERKIKTLEYKDRVVQTWYVENFLKPYFEPQFISDSYACLKNKGTHKAVEQLQKYLRRADKEYKQVWILKCDIKKFFFNINHDILYSLLKKKIKDKQFLNFSKKIIYENTGEVGIPIGNFSSQYYANVYLTELDRFIKEELKIKYSVRYMDDFVLLTRSKNESKILLEKIKQFLKQNLELELNDKTNYFKAEQGINFCGYRIWKTHILLREQSKNKMKRKMKSFQKLYKEDKIELEKITASINSWKGHTKHCNSYNLVNKMLDNFILSK